MITPEALCAAIVRHETIYLSAKLEPVVPKAGQWFCEMSYDVDEGNEIVREGSLVEFVGTVEELVGDCVISTSYVSDGDDARRPFGDAMILQY